jgi:hypothetical protein
VEESEWFTRKIEDVREADFRLANHRLQPLGHLTAARFLSIRHASSYGNAALPKIVPEIVPASSHDPPLNGIPVAFETLIRTQRFFSSTTISASDWRTPLCLDVLASTSLATRAEDARQHADLACEWATDRYRFFEPQPSVCAHRDATLRGWRPKRRSGRRTQVACTEKFTRAHVENADRYRAET